MGGPAAHSFGHAVRGLAPLGALVLAALSVGTPATAGARWGLDFGAQWSRFGAPAPAAINYPEAPDDYRVATITLGLCREAPLGRRLTLATSLRYDEWAAGKEWTIIGLGPVLTADTELKFREVVFAPAVRLALGHGFGVSLAPELAFVLDATWRATPMSLQALPAAGPRRSEGTIFEPLGTFGSRKVTGHYHRWSPAWSTGLSWEHGLASHRLRWSAEYRGMLRDPSRDGLGDAMSAWRAGLVVFE